MVRAAVPNRVARGHRRRESGGASRLHSDGTDVGHDALDGQSHSGHQPTAADGTTIASTSGTCSQDFEPQVPCPAMIAGSSKPWM